MRLQRFLARPGVLDYQTGMRSVRSAFLAVLIGSSVGPPPAPAQAQNRSATEPERGRPAHHVDGGFTNPWGLREHDEIGPSVTVPFFFGRIFSSIAGRSDAPPARVAPDLDAIREIDAAKGTAVTWIGHSAFLVQMGGVRFLTDPTWSHTASPLPVGPTRFVEPGLSIEEVGAVDFVVISHNHYDHLDIESLKALADRGTRFFVPLGNGETLERHGIGPYEEFDWWDTIEVGGAVVRCVPARHWSRRALLDMNTALWSGWTVEADGKVFYFAGDTGYFPAFDEIRERAGDIDLAALPIGAYAPRAMMEPAHMNPEEAVRAAVELQAKRTVGMHFGTFDLTEEPLGEPPARFREASRAAGRGDEVDWVLDVGETRRF